MNLLPLELRGRSIAFYHLWLEEVHRSIIIEISGLFADCAEDIFSINKINSAIQSTNNNSTKYKSQASFITQKKSEDYWSFGQHKISALEMKKAYINVQVKQNKKVQFFQAIILKFNQQIYCFTFMTLQDYQIVSKISSGKYSVVYKVRRTADKRIFALKKVPLLQMETRSKKNALTEVKLLQNFKHPNIISLIQVCYDTQQGHLCLILEYSQQGDLASQVKKRSIKREFFKEEQLWQLLYHISRGLEYLHEQNILHRDIKPSNILLFGDEVAKIADLNVSTSVQNLNYTRTGTLTYASPQIWKGQLYDNKCDIWSLGCLIYELAALQPPFQADNMQRLHRNIVKCNYNRLSQNYSRQFRDLVSFMIQINTKLRPTAKTICKISANHCIRQKDKSRLHSLTPFIQSRYRLKPIQTSLIEQNLSNLSLISSKQNTKRMIIKSQKLKNSVTPKLAFEIDSQFEKELKNAEQLKDYICNKLIKNNVNNSPQEAKIFIGNQSSIYRRVFKHPKREKLNQTRQRRHTQS